MWTKANVGKWLLFSSLIALIILVFAFMLSVAGMPNASGTLGAISLLWIIIALPTGAGLAIWSSVVTKRQFTQAQGYAELNGWMPISRTHWRARKRDATSLSVAKSAISNNYLLTIEHDGETITVDQFETPLWALQFGDWLWQELQDVGVITTDEVLDTAARGSQSLVVVNR